MKKVLTSISLAAIMVMADLPVAAQQAKFTQEEKDAIVKALVPAVFDQVKQLSGIDFMALASPDLENVVRMPAFFPATTGLRAGKSIPVSMMPDSVKMDLSWLDFAELLPPDKVNLAPILQGLVKDIKLTFKNHKEHNMSWGDNTIDLMLPEVVDVSCAAMTDSETGKPANLLSLIFTTGEKGMILPFNNLSVELKLDKLEQLAGAIPDFPLKSGKLLTISETQISTGVLHYDVTLEENLRDLIASNNPVSSYKVTCNMTRLASGLLEASLAVKTTKGSAEETVGDATVYMNRTTSAEIPVDSIILCSYNDGLKAGYKKLTPVMSVEGENMKLTTSSAVRIDQEDEWTPYASQIITMPASMGIMAGNLIDMLTDKVSGNMLRAETGLDFVVTVDSVYAARPDLIVPVMKIRAILPGNEPLVKIEFRQSEAVPEAPIATAYITSNLFGVITSNETITQAEELKVILADGGFYIKNCEKGKYMLVEMNGRLVRQGIIAGPGTFVDAPALEKGRIYILSVLENGIRKTIKFIK